MPSRALAAVAVAAVLAVLATCTSQPPAAAQADTGPTAVRYVPPVDAPVVDPFRPPATPYGPGNRGIDYATQPGTPVGAAAAGQVVFAGRVGLGLHVIVLHADGIRTSSSFLASVAVRRGQQVVAGQPLGTAGDRLHFGARAGDAYLDPLVLFGIGAGPAVVRLVPDGERAMGAEPDERRGLVRSLLGLPGAAAGVGVDAVRWAGRGAVAAGGAAADAAAGVLATADQIQAWLAAVTPPVAWAPAVLVEWWERRGDCTPGSTAVPPPAGRRRVVLVAGLASTSASAGVDQVDTASLGYAARDVVRFSYRGGSTDDTTYSAADTQVDITESGRRLRELLERLHAADPGVPIDVIAHSQGGLVARVALGARAPPGVEHLITLSTPHQGADLATALDLTGHTLKGAALQEALARAGVGGIDPTSTSVRQLSELSPFLRDLNRQPLPAGVPITSIAARADVVVPAPRARLPGATNVVVRVPGLNEHSAVTAAPAATREMVLALAGLPPACESLVDSALDALAGTAIASAEDRLGLVALAALAG